METVWAGRMNGKRDRVLCRISEWIAIVPKFPVRKMVSLQDRFPSIRLVKLQRRHDGSPSFGSDQLQHIVYSLDLADAFCATCGSENFRFSFSRFLNCLMQRFNDIRWNVCRHIRRHLWQEQWPNHSSQLGVESPIYSRWVAHLKSR